MSFQELMMINDDYSEIIEMIQFDKTLPDLYHATFRPQPVLIAVLISLIKTCVPYKPLKLNLIEEWRWACLDDRYSRTI